MDFSLSSTSGSAAPAFNLVFRSETVAQAKVLTSDDGS